MFLSCWASLPSSSYLHLLWLALGSNYVVGNLIMSMEAVGKAQLSKKLEFPTSKRVSFQTAGLHKNLLFSLLITFSCIKHFGASVSWFVWPTAGQTRLVPSNHRAILQTRKKLMGLQGRLPNPTASCSSTKDLGNAAEPGLGQVPDTYHSQPQLQTRSVSGST